MDSWTAAVIAALGRQRAAVDFNGRNVSAHLALFDYLTAQIERAKQGFMPDRPKRSYLSKKVIAAFHVMPVDECWRCHRKQDYLERAHIIDRWTGGLDAAQNLALLCDGCHRGQPIFEPGDDEQALEYVGLTP